MSTLFLAMCLFLFVDGLPVKDIRVGYAMIAVGPSGLAAGPFLCGPGIAAAFVASQWEIFSATPKGNGFSPILKAMPDCDIS